METTRKKEVAESRVVRVVEDETNFDMHKAHAVRVLKEQTAEISDHVAWNTGTDRELLKNLLESALVEDEYERRTGIELEGIGEIQVNIELAPDVDENGRLWGAISLDENDGTLQRARRFETGVEAIDPLLAALGQGTDRDVYVFASFVPTPDGSFMAECVVDDVRA